jgi:hypothetical protein
MKCIQKSGRQFDSQQLKKPTTFHLGNGCCRVPPIIYRKVKQAPEPEKEAILIRELEAILNREGLSVHASKEEIRSVRKRKEKLKDLEGIDTSNIIVESRGRRAAAANFFAPKYTEVADMSDEDGQESSDSEDPDVDPLGADHEEDD